MKHLICKPFLILFFGMQIMLSSLKAQNYEYGGGIGSANYLGEIGGKLEPRGFIADVQFSMTRPGFTGFFRYNWFDVLALNAGFSHGWIQGADSLSLSPTRWTRNLSFRNQIIELYARAELNYLNLNLIKMGGRSRLNIKTYFYMGGALFYHNPQTFYQGQWVNLRPLQTEGIKYRAIEPAIPIAGGVTLTIGRHHKFGWDLGWRKTYTDYLDDVGTFYQNPDLIQDPLTKALADRSFEVNTADERYVGTELYSNGSRGGDGASLSKRGNPDTKDSYILNYFTYSYIISKGGRAKFSKSRYSFAKPSNKSFKSSLKKSKKRHKRANKHRHHKNRSAHF